MRRRELIAMGLAAMLAPPALRARGLSPGKQEQRVVVDPRIELISVIQLLGGYFLLGDADTTYKRDALRTFDAFRDHPAVLRARRLAKQDFAYSNVADLMVRLTGPDAVAWRRDVPAETMAGITDAAERDRFIGLMRDFARRSRFRAFFERNRPLRDRVTRTIAPMVVPNVEAIQAYTGMTLGRWQVIAGLLLHDGGFGPRVIRKDGSLETYSIVGPAPDSVGDPDYRDYDRLRNFVVHEFCHSICNPMAEADPALVERYADRFEPVRAAMLKEGYGAWTSVVNEHLVRSVTARVAALRLGSAAGDKLVANEVSRGFVYVPALIGRLQLYEANRKDWPTLASYFPRLMEVFAEPVAG